MMGYAELKDRTLDRRYSTAVGLFPCIQQIQGSGSNPEQYLQVLQAEVIHENVVIHILEKKM